MKKIIITGNPARKISPEEVAKALGAKEMTHEEVKIMRRDGKLPSVPWQNDRKDQEDAEAKG